MAKSLGPRSPTWPSICAGTTDLPVATEASRTLQFMGIGTTLIADVGVAGLWRLLDTLERIAAHRVVIAVAGMEGALFSVLGGLVQAPIIAVPTSVAMASTPVATTRSTPRSARARPASSRSTSTTALAPPWPQRAC